MLNGDASVFLAFFRLFKTNLQKKHWKTLRYVGYERKSDGIRARRNLERMLLTLNCALAKSISPTKKRIAESFNGAKRPAGTKPFWHSICILLAACFQQVFVPTSACENSSELFRSDLSCQADRCQREAGDLPIGQAFHTFLITCIKRLHRYIQLNISEMHVGFEHALNAGFSIFSWLALRQCHFCRSRA